MSQVSRDEFGGAGETLDCVVDMVEGWAKGRGELAGWIVEFREDRSEESIVGADVEERGAKTVVGDAVAVGVGNGLDEPVEAKATKVVGHAALGHEAGVQAQQRSEEVTQVAIGEPSELQTQDDECGEEGTDTGLNEWQRGDTPGIYELGKVEFGEVVLADLTVVAGVKDVKQTSIGVEADLPQGGQVEQPFADVEVTGVVDGGLGSQCMARNLVSC
jgi:hypothetical protein